MIKKEISLSEVAEYFKKNKISSFDEDIDEFGSYFITAGRIAAMVLASDPISMLSNFCSGIDAASLRASKLFSWLPDKFKYGNRGRERAAIERYDLSSVISFLLLQVAIKESLKSNIIPLINSILDKVSIDKREKKKIQKACNESDKDLQSKVIRSNSPVSKYEIEDYSISIINPILPKLLDRVQELDEANKKLKKIELHQVEETYVDKVYSLYNAFLINFSSEFPEFALWVDVSIKDRIFNDIKLLAKDIKSEQKEVHKLFSKKIQLLTQQIEKINSNTFVSTNGFPTFADNYKSFFQTQINRVEDNLTKRVRENVLAHQTQIKEELNKPLSDNKDIEDIKFPKNKEIYIAQGFEAITYKRKEHKKGFLTSSSLYDLGEEGEDIGSYLLKTLIDPNFASKPILILGNPGAGKSMLSKMFAGELCDTNDMIPFLVRLRDVASSSANISEHINKGLALSIVNVNDINWLDWAKEFKERIPVIIMDGFDELMQSSSTELNGYVSTIKEFQERALFHGICVRIILTSRIAVMQDVTIPDGTKIIKLKSFDSKRQKLWVKKWDSFQSKKGYKFNLPKNAKIAQLAQEPLLLFMLAVYDFEKAELQKLSMDKNFNQSKLYDSLLNEFAKRQLGKNKLFENTDEETRKKETQLFRLRLGMIALMMFLNDTSHRGTNKLKEELEAFNLHESKIQSSNILGGFFFVHENKSVTEGDIEQYNYEFLHKTFAEFLAADFLLRIALMQYTRYSRDESVFRFCYGYNWLHKHHNIQNFLYEYAPQLVEPNSKESDYIISEIIIPDLEKLFDKISQNFPVVEIRLIPHKPKIEHLAIYSQNIIFLWLALTDASNPTSFQIFNNCDIQDNTEYEYEAQDRDEQNQNKLLWKRLSKLWALVGNNNATAKINEWISVKESNSEIVLRKHKSEVKHNFLTCSKVGCNDFEFLLSLFDRDYKFSNKDNILNDVIAISERKPEFSPLVIDIILYRFNDFSQPNVENSILFLLENRMTKKQITLLFQIMANTINQLDRPFLINIMRNLGNDRMFIRESDPITFSHFLKLLLETSKLVHISEIIDTEGIDDISRKIYDDARYAFDESYKSIEYLKVLYELFSYPQFAEMMHPKMSEELIYRLFNDLSRTPPNNSIDTLEFIRMVRLLGNSSLFRRTLDPELMREIGRKFSKDLKYILRGNPRNSLQYITLLEETTEDFPLLQFVDPGHIKYLIHFLFEELEYNNRNFQGVTNTTYIKTIVTLDRYFPIRKVVAERRIKNAVYLISNELKYTLRERQSETLEQLEFLIEFGPLEFLAEILSPELIKEISYVYGQNLNGIIRKNPRVGFGLIHLMEHHYGRGETLKLIKKSFPQMQYNEMYFEQIFDFAVFYSRITYHENFH